MHVRAVESPGSYSLSLDMMFSQRYDTTEVGEGRGVLEHASGPACHVPGMCLIKKS